MSPALPPSCPPVGNGPLRALIVDDDPDLGRLLTLRLRSRGLEVESAASGEEAIASIDSRNHVPAHPMGGNKDSYFDLVLLDVAMPGMNGLEVLARIRADGKDLYVVMMTAYGSEKMAIDAIRRGADDYLHKPFESGELAAVLDRTLERIRLRRENAALSHRLEAQRLELEAELSRAGLVQRSLLPEAPPPLEGFDIDGACLPALWVGGDFFDWIPVPDGLVAILGDVMGKGMGAALWMATIRAALRVALARLDPPGALSAVADAIEGDLDRAGVFVTLLLVRVGSDGLATYVDAGHGIAGVYRRDGRIEPLLSGGLPIGVLPGMRWTQGQLRLEPGDSLVAASDGAFEVLEGGILDVVGLVGGAASAKEGCARLTSLAPTASVLADDLTVVVIRRMEGHG